MGGGFGDLVFFKNLNGSIFYKNSFVMKKFNYCAIYLFFIVFVSCGETSKKRKISNKIRMLKELGDDCHTPDGAAIDSKGNLYISVPNFANASLKEQNEIDSIYPAKIIRINPENEISDWYVFNKADFHKKSKGVGPMDLAFGSDSNLYVNDNQFFLGLRHESRLLRINCESGVAKGCEVLVTGFDLCNGLTWNRGRLYITESNLGEVQEQGKKYGLSGVFVFTQEELNSKQIALPPHQNKNPNLLVSLKLRTGVGFGADGICFDDENNLYTGTFTNGDIYRITLDPSGNVLKKNLWVMLGDSASSDGMVWRSKDKKLYVVDMLRNALLSVDKNGEVAVVHQNGDTDGTGGLLDQPAEVILRGDKAIVVNMDTHWEEPLLYNKKHDKPYTISEIDLD